MPHATILELPATEQAQMLGELRRARYGYLLALHILLLCAAQRSPTEIAAVLFCSRSTVYRVARAYRAGQWDHLTEEDGPQKAVSRRPPQLSPTLRRSVLGILHSVPRVCGWCRTRWSCATVALELFVRRRITVSSETVRRWLHECWFDYRVSAIRNLLVPVLLWSYKVPAATWWSHVERAMLAFDDLACEELLEQ